MTGNTALDVFVVAGIVAGGLGLVAVFSRAAAWLWAVISALKNFLDDWRGEASRPGVPARPGIPERLARIEEQFGTNGGKTFRDLGDRLERAVRRVEDGLSEHLKQHQLTGTVPIVNNTTVIQGDGEVAMPAIRAERPDINMEGRIPE
ncbi:hypothetical protein ACQPYK_25560 [Streptosporangium sp. CA-135522]|uniref:hypothetical protein n=1 Tax=Streptosporangium sp. CA-135522 TaxID=3240072 RepID=UPI003D9092DF